MAMIVADVDENYVRDQIIHADKSKETVRQMNQDAAKKWTQIHQLSIDKVDGSWTRIRDETRDFVSLDVEANDITTTLKELKKKEDGITGAMRLLDAARIRTHEMKSKMEKRNSQLKDADEPQRIKYLEEKLEKYKNQIAADAEAVETHINTE